MKIESFTGFEVSVNRGTPAVLQDSEWSDDAALAKALEFYRAENPYYPSLRDADQRECELLIQAQMDGARVDNGSAVHHEAAYAVGDLIFRTEIEAQEYIQEYIAEAE